MFTRSDNYSALNGSSLRLRAKFSPYWLTRHFDAPDASDGYKVSMEWLFEDEDGNVVALYDWKSTSLYDEGLPSPELVRSQSTPLEFHIGSRSYDVAQKFLEWLNLGGRDLGVGDE